MFILNLRRIAIAAAAVGAVCGQSAFAQGSTTIFDPYVPGVQITLHYFLQPRALHHQLVRSYPIPSDSWSNGSSSSDAMGTSIPANSIDQSFTGLSLPLGSASLTPPGVLGPALSGSFLLHLRLQVQFQLICNLQEQHSILLNR